MKAQVMHFDEISFSKEMREIKATIAPLQKLLNEFNKLAIFQISKVDQLSDFVRASDKTAYIKNKIAEKIGTVQIGAFKQNPHKVVETLDLPSFAEAIQAAVECERAGISPGQVGHLQLHNNNQIKMIEGEEERIKERYTYYADTKAKVRVTEAYKKFVQALTEYEDAIIEEGVGQIAPNTQFASVVAIGNDYKVSPRTDMLVNLFRK